MAILYYHEYQVFNVIFIAERVGVVEIKFRIYLLFKWDSSKLVDCSNAKKSAIRQREFIVSQQQERIFE